MAYDKIYESEFYQVNHHTYVSFYEKILILKKTKDFRSHKYTYMFI